MTQKQVPRTYAIVAAIVLMIAGVLLDHFGFRATTEVSVERNISESHAVDSEVDVHRNAQQVQVPPASLESAVTGVALGESDPQVGQVDSTNERSFAGDGLSDTIQYHILVPRSDTLKNGAIACDTLDFKQLKNTVFNLRIGHAPFTIFVYDTVTHVRDTTHITDSVVTRAVPTLALELKTGLHYPTQTIGSIIQYGLELSYTHKDWTYSIEPYVFATKPGCSLWIKYRLL